MSDRESRLCGPCEPPAPWYEEWVRTSPYMKRRLAQIEETIQERANDSSVYPEASNEQRARRLGLEVGWASCVCGHGLVWHDPDRVCNFRFRERQSSQCQFACQHFEEAEWSRQRQSAPRDERKRAGR